jgi:integrase
MQKVAQLGEDDRDALTRFDQHLTVQQLALGSRVNYIDGLLRIRRLLDKPFRDATKEDIEKALSLLPASGKKRELSETTVLRHKIVLKRFYKWFVGNGEEYPANVKWIKTSAKNGRKLPRDSLLTNDEIEALARVCVNDRDRAIIFVLAESGIRAGELLSLRINDVRFDQYGAIINVSGKTGDRAVRLIASSPALATWIEHHPLKDDPAAPLWINIRGCWGFAKYPMTYNSLKSVLMGLKARANIKKRVHLHGFRHTAATRLARLLTEAEMKQYLGWVQGSQMAGVYVHLASRDVDKAMLRIHGLITEDEDRERKFTAKTCPRCHQTNSPGTETCSKCGLALTFEAARAIDEKEKRRQALMEKVKEMPEFEKLKDLIELLGEKLLSE